MKKICKCGNQKVVLEREIYFTETNKSNGTRITCIKCGASLFVVDTPEVERAYLARKGDVDMTKGEWILLKVKESIN